MALKMFLGGVTLTSLILEEEEEVEVAVAEEEGRSARRSHPSEAAHEAAAQRRV